MNTSNPDVTVVIPNWNGERWLPGCLAALAEQTYQNFIVIMVDNHSTDGSVAFVRVRYPQVYIIEMVQNFGFATGVNTGIADSQTKYVALLNNDTLPAPDWLERLVNVLENSPPDVGSVASKMMQMSNPSLLDDAGNILTWQTAAYKRGFGQPADCFNEQDEVFSACAGAALYRRDFLEELRCFDDHFWAYLEDVDLGLQGQLRGYRCVFVPDARVQHYRHGTSLPRPHYVRLMTRNRLMLFGKSIPFNLLIKNILKIAYGQIYFLLIYRQLWQSIQGYLSFLPKICHVWRARRKNLDERKISDRDLQNLLHDGFLMEPPLRQVIRNRLCNLFG